MPDESPLVGHRLNDHGRLAHHSKSWLWLALPSLAVTVTNFGPSFEAVVWRVLPNNARTAIDAEPAGRFVALKAKLV